MVQKIAWFVFVFNLLAYCIYLISPIEFRKGIHHIEAGALGYITSAERYELED